MNPTTPMTSRAGEPWVASRMQADDPGQDVEHGRERRPSGAATTSPYWMTREPPLNWVGVTLASSAPWTVSKTSFATLSPSWTNEAPMTVRAAGERVERAVAGGDEDAQDDRDDRRGEERQPGRAQGQEPERQLRLDRRAALHRHGIEVAARLADRTLRVFEERDLGLVPAPGAGGAVRVRASPVAASRGPRP